MLYKVASVCVTLKFWVRLVKLVERAGKGMFLIRGIEMVDGVSNIISPTWSSFMEGVQS